jgi:hypothetical protein
MERAMKKKRVGWPLAVSAVGLFWFLCSSLTFVACAGCVSALGSCTLTIPPKAFSWPFEVLVWLVRTVLKALYPFLFE